VTGCLHPTPADILSVLAGIQPAELLPKGVTLSLACRTTESGHLLHSTLTRSLGGNARRLKSRHPFVPTAPHDSNNRRAALCADSEVAGEHCETLYFHLQHRHPLSHNDPARNSVVQLYRHPTGVRRFRSCLHKWGMDTSAACECGAEAGPPRDISPGVTKTDTGPSYFLGPSSKLVLFVY